MSSSCFSQNSSSLHFLHSLTGSWQMLWNPNPSPFYTGSPFRQTIPFLMCKMCPRFTCVWFHSLGLWRWWWWWERSCSLSLTSVMLCAVFVMQWWWTNASLWGHSEGALTWTNHWKCEKKYSSSYIGSDLQYCFTTAKPPGFLKLVFWF